MEQIKREAVLITIGDELLIGQVIDTNSAWIAGQLNHLGIRVKEILSVADQHIAILEALGRASQTANLVIITGGLGPTKDDITKFAISCFYGVEMVFHDETFRRLSDYFKARGREMDDSLKHQCNMPVNAEILLNDLGTAPGMWFDSNGVVMVSMPGVPYEMKHIMESSVIPRLKSGQFAGMVLHHTVSTAGVGETDLARKIIDIESNLPSWASIAYLPGAGQVRVRLSAYDIAAIQEAEFRQMSQAIETAISKHIYSTKNENLEEALGNLLINMGKTVSVAESCTGGYIAHKITLVPGASAYFKGGFIPYHNDLKINFLGVSPETISQHGAVSQETVEEMVTGTLKMFQSDIAITISGIAGPGGGTPDKPVGTTWIAVGDGTRTVSRKINFSKDRLRNIEYDATITLYLALKFLQGQEFA